MKSFSNSIFANSTQSFLISIQNNFSNQHSNALLLDTSVHGSYKPVSK